MSVKRVYDENDHSQISFETEGLNLAHKRASIKFMVIDNWDRLVRVFQLDDGSLPDIEINELARDEVVSGYAFVRDHSGKISSKAPSYWSATKECDVPITYTENPAALVVSGEANAFHLCFSDIQGPSGYSIPELGLYVYADGLSFDYRMGPEWDRRAVEALFEMIYCMSMSFEKIHITHKTNINDYDGSIFASHWDKYKKGRDQE